MTHLPVPSVTIMGLGAVGGALHDFFVQQQVTIVSAWSRSGGTMYRENLPAEKSKKTIPSDNRHIGQWVFITTPDDLISEISHQLAKQDIEWGGRTVIHCSGNLTSEELSSLASKGAQTASMHPIQTFTRGDSGARFKGCTISLEGNEEVVIQLETLIEAMHGVPLRINKKQKRAVHIAAVFASNYLVSILSASEDVLSRSGLETDISVFKPLIHQTIENCFEKGTSNSLTGPVSRGDADSVQKHLDALHEEELLQEIYSVLGKQALEIIKKRDVNPELISRLNKLLSNSG